MFDHNNSYHNDTHWLYDCDVKLSWDGRRIGLFLLYLSLFMVGLVENCLVVWVNWHRRHSASGVLFCIINISLSDLMVVSIMPFFMLEIIMNEVWVWGQFLCKVTNVIYVINFYSSSIFLAFMTLERYLTITRPNTPACFPLQPRRRRWLLCAGVWLLSLVLALLENVHVVLLESHQPGCYLIPEHSHEEWILSLTLFSFIFQFLIPGSVIITCNIRIARAMRATLDIQNHREIWILHVYSTVFVACWLPYHAVLLLMTVDIVNPYLMSCKTTEVLFFSINVVQCISLFHCIANPILYNFLNKDFRTNLSNDIVSCISSPTFSMVYIAADGVEISRRKERKLSNASTSHSETGP